MARPHPYRPPLSTVVPGGAVAARAKPRVSAVLSPRTMTRGGSTAGPETRNGRTATGAAAVATVVVPTTTTATVAPMAASAGPAAVSLRQNTPSMTGRSTR